MRRLLHAVIMAAAPAWALAGPAVLTNTDHIVGDLTTAIGILGGTVGPSGIIINQTCATGGPGYNPGSTCGGTNSFVEPGTLFATYATNTSITNYLPASATPANSAPYALITQSSTGYTLNLIDQQPYATLEAAGALYNMAYCGGPSAGDAYPPIAASNIMPNYAPSLTTAQCGYALGVEFSMSAGYKGFDTSTPSGTTEAEAGILAMLKAMHPTWLWGDIKGALRQTASNWSTGYAVCTLNGAASCSAGTTNSYGFGNVNYDGAVALSGPSAIYLQGPGFLASPLGHYAVFTIYPYLSTRRAREVVYVGGTWPAASSVNELTAAQIAAAGGTKIFDDGGATGVQSFTYAPAVTGTVSFVALTLDSSGNGSRIESYESIPVSFVVGTACLQ